MPRGALSDDQQADVRALLPLPLVPARDRRIVRTERFDRERSRRVAARSAGGDRHTVQQRQGAKGRALPGVQAGGAISILPLGGGWSRTSIAIEGRAEMTNLLPQARPRIHPRTVTPDYFQALGIPLLNGRFLTSKDDLNTPLVALINQTAAQRYWPGQNPLGHRVQIGGGAPWREVIGIVGDVKDQGLDQEINSLSASLTAQNATGPKLGGYIISDLLFQQDAVTVDNGGTPGDPSDDSATCVRCAYPCCAIQASADSVGQPSPLVHQP